MQGDSSLDSGVLERLNAFVKPALWWLPTARSRTLGLSYLAGLIGPGERKSTEPIVRRQQGGAAPSREKRTREMLTDDDWNAQSLMLAGAAQLVESTDGWSAYVLDDTAIIKRGYHSVGVGKQYAGCVGHVTGCQCVVTLGLASDAVSTLVLARLFLPQTWFANGSAKRRAEAHVPEVIARRGYQTKHEIALKLVDALRIEGMPKLPILFDSGYGGSTEFRQALAAQGEQYVASVTLDMSVWDAAATFAPPKRKPGQGRPPNRMVPASGRTPRSVLEMAKSLPSDAWTEVMWREGSRGPQRSRFAAVRVRAARGYDRATHTVVQVHPEEWLLVHWPADNPEPTKAWLSNLPSDTTLVRLVQLARLRWRIERDHQEAKELLGFDHYEGRSWHGLHHHLALVLLAQQFLALEKWKELKDAQRTSPSTVLQQRPPEPPLASAPKPQPAAAPITPQHEALPPCAPAAVRLRDRRAHPGDHRPRALPVLPDVPPSR